MSRSLNQVNLIGNLGSDPEVRTVAGGKKVATISIATSRQWTNQSGEKQESTQWHRCVVWDKLAEIVEQYVKKGDRIFVCGSIEYRQWQDKEGQTRYSTEINVREIVMLGSSGETSGGKAKSTPPKARRVDDDDVIGSLDKIEEEAESDLPF